MPTIVTMPKWGLTMTSGTITGWSREEGDPVTEGAPLLTVETEKAVDDVEAPASGVLRKIVAAVGSEVPVMGAVAVITAPGEDLSDDDLVMFFENKVLYGTKGEVPEGDEGIPLGVADVKREGDDVTIVAISRMVQQALAAADALSAEGIEAEVIDPRTLSPLDDETILTSVAKTHRLLIVDEDNPRCSVATDIAAMVADKGFDTLDAPIKRVTAPHTPVPFSPPLEQFYVPSPDRIADAVREIV